MTFYVENAIKSPKKDCRAKKKELNKATGCKINIQTPIVFLCTIREQSKIKIRTNIIYCIIASKI